MCHPFPQTRRVCKVSKVRFSTSSMTRFATADETGEPIAVPKTCLQCFPWKLKFIELKQISSPLIRLVVEKFVRWLSSGLYCRCCLAMFNASWIWTFVNKDTASNETITSSVWSNSGMLFSFCNFGSPYSRDVVASDISVFSLLLWSFCFRASC